MPKFKAKYAAPPPPPRPAYSLRNGFRSPVSPDVIAERILYLRNILGRNPSGSDILEDARPVGSPLHDHFEWDDTLAAESWRRHQAGEMASAVRVHVVQHDGSAVVKPAFISQFGDEGIRGFVPVAIATAAPFRERTLADVIRKYWTMMSREKGLGYCELEPLFEVIDQLYEDHCK